MSALMAFTMSAMAQGNPNAEAIRQSQAYCPQLFNPTQFNITGNNPARASWTGFGGTKLGQASTVGNWGASYSSTATGAQMDAATTSGAQSWIYSGSSCTIGNESANNVYQKRFMIVNAGMDDLTGNHMSKVPSDPDTTFLRAIRLGNRCGGTGAEKLQYQFMVTPQNALLVLYYALSLENGQHDNANNPEFVIEVQVGQSTPTTVQTNLNSYDYTPLGQNYFFVRPTPDHSNSNVDPFYVGSTGTHTGASYGSNVYLPWNKVVINLGNYLNKPVRILVGAGDCAYSAHYAYSYVAGYCRPMSIQVDGCPIGNTTAVSTLTAPSGLEDPTYTADPSYHAYQWYICNDPNISAENLGMSYPDSDFAANFTAIPGANDSAFETQVNHFFLNGDTISRRAFACVMTTYMNQSTGTGGHRTYPIVSRLYADAQNQKPQIAFDPVAYCDGSVSLINRSYCGVPGFMRDQETQYTLYNNSMAFGDPIATLTGKDVVMPTDSARTYYVKMRVPTDSASCYSEITMPITSIQNPRASFTVSNEEPCLGQEVVLTNTTSYISTTGNAVSWSFSDSTTSNQNTVNHEFTLDHDTVWMYVTNGYTEPIGNSLTNTRHCADSAFKVIKVFNSPELEVSPDTIVCEGQQTQVTVSVVDDDPTATYEYEWARRIGGSIIQSGNVLRQTPDANSPTSTYYVKVTRMPQGCEAWDSVTVHVVRPTLTMLPADGKICPGEEVKLIAGNAHHYTWQANRDDQSLVGQETSDTIIVSPDQTTTYTLIGHGSDDCNADPLTSTVTVYQTPILALTYNPDFVDSEDPVVTFRDVSANGVDARWDFGGGEIATGRQVSHTFGDMSSDSVHVTMTSFNALGNRAPGCFADTTFALPIQLFSVWMPNIFTPNLANNRTFRLITANDLENFHLYLYDRHGQMILDTYDQKFEWDGTYQGVECPQGSYVYVYTYRRPGTSVVVSRKGTVTLIR